MARLIGESIRSHNKEGQGFAGKSLRNDSERDLLVRLCIYCDKLKNDQEFTLEHIFPSSLGGSLLPSLFKTRDVCARCNNLSGLFIDGLFIKGVANILASSFLTFCDPRRSDSVSPLKYMGTLSNLELPSGKTCEFWLGAVGEKVFHIHDEDDERWASYMGGDIIRRRSDPGKVFIQMTSSQVDWVMLMLRSAKTYFPKAERFGVGITINGAQDFISEMDENANATASLIEALPLELQTTLVIPYEFDARFMCKMALGLGYTLFGNSFLEADYTHRLRSAMWEPEREARAAYKINGSVLLANNDNAEVQNFGWKGGYTIRLIIVNEGLLLSVHFPSGSATHVVLSKDKDLWPRDKHAALYEGLVYVVCPQANYMVGPMSVGEFMMHKIGVRSSPEMEQLERFIINPSDLPAPR